MHRHKRTHGSRDSRESDVSSGGSQTSQSKATTRGPGTSGPGRKRKSSIDAASLSGTSNGLADVKPGGHAKCPLCPESFFSELSLESHVHTVHQGQSIQCDECSHSFPSYTYLKLHKNMYHPSPNFPLRSAFQLAALSSMGQQPPPPLKDEVVPQPLPKKKEENVLDLSSPVKPMTPSQLPPADTPSRLSQFTSIEQLTSNDPNEMINDENDHLIRDMKLKGEFPCRLCDAVFPNLRALKGHNKEHMDRPPYICNVGTCTYSSNDKSTLARHMRTHTGEKPFECTICNFGFTTKANCERHVKNKHGKSTREEVRDSILIHESAESESMSNHGDKHLLNTSMTESNGSDSARDTFREDDTPSPAKKRRHDSGLVNERIFAPYRSTMYRPQQKSNDVHETKAKDFEKHEPDAPLDLSRPNTGDSLKENSLLTKDAANLMTKGGMPNPMDFTKSLAAMAASAGIPGLSGQMPFQLAFQLSQLANASSPGNSFDWAAYLLAHQQQEALRRQREAELAAAAMASSVAGSKDPTAFLMHLSNLQSFQSSAGAGGPLATSPEKVPVTNEEKSDCSDGDYKMVIKNGVLMKKQKQRRYRTERPHECEHCNARFTLRSNMDRHIKQQHSGVEGSGTKVSDEDFDREDKQLIIDDFDNHSKKVDVEEMDDIDEEEGIDLSSLEAIAKENSSKPFNTFFDTTDEEDEDDDIKVDGSASTADQIKRVSAYSSAPHKIECPFCTRTFPWSSSMKRHILTHTGQKPYKCPECPLWFTTKSNCDRHLVRKHGNNNIEKKLGVSIPTSTTDNHVVIAANNSPLYQRHLNETNGNEGDASSNDEDDHHTSSSSSHHHRSASGGNAKPDMVDNPFKCYLCDDGHTTREDALSHLQSAHPVEYESLATKGAFDSSATEVSASPPNNEVEDTFDALRGQFPDYANRRVICLFCMRKFWSAEDLRRHVRTHTGEKPYECDICRRKFTLKHSMLRHRKKHDSGVSSGGEDDTDSEGGHSSASSALELGRSSPEDAKTPSSLVKKKKPSLMDKINQLSSAVNNGNMMA